MSSRQKKQEAELTEEEKKKREEELEDAQYKENEIKRGIRFKLSMLFSGLIIAIIILITYVASSSQAESLRTEKNTQAKIVLNGLSSSIKASVIDVIGSRKYEKLSSPDEYKDYYRSSDLADKFLELMGEASKQPDVVYAYVLGQHGIVWGHTDPLIDPYSTYKFLKGQSPFKKLVEAKLQVDPKFQLLEPIPSYFKFKINPEDEDENEASIAEYTKMLTFKENSPHLKDSFGEVHVGINLEPMYDKITYSTAIMQGYGFAALIFAIIVTTIFATLITRPIRRIIKGMQQVTQGNFSASVVVKSKDEVGRLSNTFNVMLKGMSILVSPEVAQVVLRGGDLIEKSERKIVSVLFSDIRSFTAISETLAPREVVVMLNNYMEIMTDIILKYGGVVDKFVGDQIFAVYGTPFEHPMHSLCACATAVEMGVQLAEHNKEREDLGKPPIGIGIGVNTGDVISGAMGSSKRVDYTSIGDAVNLGARLEGTNKIYGTLSIMSEFTHEVVKDDVVSRELDLIRVKGKNKPVKIFEVLDLTEAGKKKIDAYLAKLKKEEKT